MASVLPTSIWRGGERRSPRAAGGRAALVAAVLGLFLAGLAAPTVHLAAHALALAPAVDVAAPGGPSRAAGHVACAHDAWRVGLPASAPEAAVAAPTPVADTCNACALLGGPASPSLAPAGADLGVRDRATGPPTADASSVDRLLLGARRARAPPLA